MSVEGGSRLRGQVVAITGGASGVGLAVAEACLDEGADVALIDRDIEAATGAAHRLSAESRRAIPIACDISVAASVRNAFAEIDGTFGRLDGLVNSAGVAQVNASGRIEDITDQIWAVALAVNLTGTFLCCRESMELLGRSGNASIVNIASTAALVAEPGLDAYSAAKGGVVALTRSLAVSSAGRGVRVNAVCPGLLRTPMSEAIGGPLWQHLTSSTLLEIPGPEAVSGLAVYLLSADARYMTGSTLVIDGGYTAQ